MKYIYFITLLILASTTLSSAQFDNAGISQNCQNALFGLLGNPDVNNCFPFTKVIGLVTSGTTIPNDTALSSAADAICDVPKCSDGVVSSSLNTVNSSCQSEISSKVPIVSAVYNVLVTYSPTRDSLCFKNSTGGYCFVETGDTVARALQNSTNQNTLLIIAGLPAASVCTPCNKAIANSYVNYVNAHKDVLSQTQFFNNQTFTTVKNNLQTKCGQTFLDGQIGDSKADPKAFQDKNKKSDATSLIAINMSFIVVLLGTILATL